MTDHDQRFKALIREFFGDFLRLFFAEWAERLDCANVEWLDKEVFPDPPEGSRHLLDLVARLPTRLPVPGLSSGEAESLVALVHLEIESPDKGAAALRKIKDAPLTDQKRFLLAECVQAYLPLGEKQQREFEGLIATEKYHGVRQMNTTWFDKGIQQGIQQGMERGREQERRAVL